MTDLHRLAALHGILLSYRDVNDRLVEASTESLLATLRPLGVDITAPEQASGLVVERRRQLARRLLSPVTVAFDGGEVPVELRVPERLADSRVTCRLALEDGTTHEWTEDLAGRQPLRVDKVDDVRHPVLPVSVRGLPYGYHRLTVEVAGEQAGTLLVVAPPRAYGADDPARAWGAFLPLYALRTKRDRGVGDLTDLADLAGWLRELGGTVVGTLPLLAVYLDGDHADPSPYSPVSRLFWNELYLDLSRAPETARSDDARRLLEGDDLDRARSAEHVDYRSVAAARGRVLRALSERYFSDPGDRRSDLERFIAERPEVEDYALFRGAVARYGPQWWRWPDDARDRRLDLDLVDVDVARHHLYGQLLARDQVAALSGGLRAVGQHPYLDLPIGARADGYDAWRYREVFALDASTGAPPDAIFTGGQDWSFPPLHPERLREHGYDYLIRVLRHHLELADYLRIDHVMGLHRLFWIPEGLSARDGVYVRYPAQELYAIVNLESHRHRSRIVGENLGTVPPQVEEALQTRGVLRMYVVQYETEPTREKVLDPVADDTVASVNTHDMPPFAAWWQGLDIADSVDLGLMDEAEAERARVQRGTVRRRVTEQLTAAGHLAADRTDDPGSVLAALLEWLGASDAPVVIANLEDLWLEERPQNTPGTAEARPNWRRRAALTFDDLQASDRVCDPLSRLNASRRGRDG